MIRRGIEQALMQAKHIVAGPLGRKIVESGAVSRPAYIGVKWSGGGRQ